MKDNLKIQLVNDNKLMISINDYDKYFVDEIYFIGKMGSDCRDYMDAINSYIKIENKIKKITRSDLQQLTPDNNFLVIYVDTPFSYRFDRLLESFKAEIINDMIELENKNFENFLELLKKFQHIIIQ